MLKSLSGFRRQTLMWSTDCLTRSDSFHHQSGRPAPESAAVHHCNLLRPEGSELITVDDREMKQWHNVLPFSFRPQQDRNQDHRRRRTWIIPSLVFVELKRKNSRLQSRNLCVIQEFVFTGSWKESVFNMFMFMRQTFMEVVFHWDSIIYQKNVNRFF